MTKKNFIALADMIREVNDNEVLSMEHCFDDLQIKILADYCQAQNPRFNRARWLGYIAGTNGKNGGGKK